MKLCWNNTSWHNKNHDYIRKQEGLYQNKVTSSLASTNNCKLGYSQSQYEFLIAKLNYLFIPFMSISL